MNRTGWAVWIGLGCVLLAARAQEPPPKPGTFSGRQFPAERFRTPDRVQFLGIQYGDRPEEVVVLAFDLRQPPPNTPGQRPPPARYDVMHVYTPWMPEFQTPRSFTGQPWRDRLPSGRLGREILQFSSFRLSTTREGSTIDLTFNMTWQPGRRRPAGRVQLALSGPRGRGRMELDLGRLRTMAADAPLQPIVLLGPPRLEMRVLENGRTVSAALLLGDGRALMPGPGAFGAMQFEVRQGERSVDQKTMRPNRDLFGEHVELYRQRVGALPAGQTYAFVITSDLGPLGKVRAEENVTVEQRPGRP
jgi:hypothetical protein